MPEQKAKAPEITAVWKDKDGDYWLEIEGRFFYVAVENATETRREGAVQAYVDRFGPLVQVLP
jgi:hypothetical protein